VLLCDDLGAAIDVLRRSERDLATLDGATAARTSPVVADLLRFWVSEAAFAVRKQCEELRQAVDSTLEAMWADGSLNKIKRVYLDPLEIEPAAHP